MLFEWSLGALLVVCFWWVALCLGWGMDRDGGEEGEERSKESGPEGMEGDLGPRGLLRTHASSLWIIASFRVHLELGEAI